MMDIQEEIARLNVIGFLKESNLLAGMSREPTEEEVAATEMFLALPQITVQDAIDYARVWSPAARLRDSDDIRGAVMGDIVAPPSGPHIFKTLGKLLGGLYESDPYDTHVELVKLMPLTEGNGVLSRGVWAWQMMNKEGTLNNGFFVRFYFQSIMADKRPLVLHADINSIPKEIQDEIKKMEKRIKK